MCGRFDLASGLLATWDGGNCSEPFCVDHPGGGLTAGIAETFRKVARQICSDPWRFGCGDIHQAGVSGDFGC